MSDDYYTYYSQQDGWQAPPTPPQQPKNNGGKRAGLAALAVAGMIAVGGASGALGAYAVMKNYTPDQATQAAQAAQDTTQTTQNAAPSQDTLPLATEPPAQGGDLAAAVDKAASSVVEILVESTQTMPFVGQQTTEGAGSGVIISEDGYIVTNDHVIADASAITVRTADGREYDATLVGTDAETDLAVLKIEANGLRAVTFADSSQLSVGQTVVAIGNPLGELGGTVTDGIISALERDVTIEGTQMSLLQTSAAVSPGNSGGGLFDTNGNLVGVINAKSTGTAVEGLGFAIPANTVQQIANDIRQNGYVTGRVQLGISVIEVSEQSTQSQQQGQQGEGWPFPYNRGQQGAQPESAQRYEQPGVYVVQVTVDNGLAAGDRIVSIDGAQVTTTADVTSALEGHSVGDTLSVVVEREGQQVTVSVKLTEKLPDYMQERQKAA